MAARKLPLDLEEEILVRVPPLSLLRFRSVCKAWNTLSRNKRFVNQNFALARPEFLLKTYSTIYSISVNLNEDPTIKVTDLCFGLGGRRCDLFGNCDGYFHMHDLDKGGVFSNPLLRHTKWIATREIGGFTSMGYDGSRPEKSYKYIERMTSYSSNEVTTTFSVLEFANNVWKVTSHTRLQEGLTVDESFVRVSLNGNLYWTAYSSYLGTGQFFIQVLDFSKEIVKPFCILPCKGEKDSHSRVLALYKGDRFSLVEQCKRTREIEIWVTKKKIGNGDDVVWIKFMNVAIPKFPRVCNYMSSSYFVDDNIYGKSYVVCFPSKKPKQAWVYVVRGDLCKKIKIDGVACKFQSSVYVPSLITIS